MDDRESVFSTARAAVMAGGLAMLLGAPAAQAVDGVTYDFEDLPLNHVLNAQDGWYFQPDFGWLVTRQDDSPANGTQVVQPLAGVASGFFAYLTRPNNSAFRYSPYFGNETSAVSQVDVNAMAAAGVALGRDINGDQLLMLESGERGPAFGTFRDSQQSVANFVIQSVDGVVHAAPLITAQRCCNQDDDWYRLQLRMDLTANDGAGAGSLYYKNLTRGDDRFQAVAELQNVNLHLDQMSALAGPTRWLAMHLIMRFDGSQHMPSLDNVVPRVPIVLQRDLTMHVQAVDATVPIGAKFDLLLTPATVASDPTGLYWRLAQFRVVDSSTPSTTTMQSNWDLTMARVDVIDALDDADSVSSVELEFQSWDGVNPTSMLWKLGSFMVP